MADFDEYFRAALTESVKERGSQARLARDSGVGTSYINNIVKGRDSGSEATRRALAAALGFSGRRYEDFLEMGRALLEGREIPAIPPAGGGALATDFFRVPWSENTRLAPGSDGVIPVTLEEEESPVAVHGPTLGRANSWGLRAFGVDQEAMEPLIARGGVALVDMRQNDYRKIINDQIYLVHGDFSDGEAWLRRLEWAGLERDRLALKAADGRYSTLYRNPREIRILGRVICAWRVFE